MLVTLGDLLLDVIVRAPGGVGSTEPPRSGGRGSAVAGSGIHALASGADTPAETRIASGGQAANVAAWAAELGGSARFVGKQADDAAGALVRSLLERRGVELAGPRVEGRTGVVVAFVGPEGERSMATDRGVAPDLRSDELEPGWFADCDWLHLSGYSLLAEPIAQAALEAVRLARAHDAQVSVDLSSWSAIRDYGPALFRSRLEELCADVLFANEPEWELVGGAYALAGTAVVKRGSRGVTVYGERGAGEYPAPAAEVVDTTGAGDALAAGFVVGGIELGLEAAARCVGRLGAVPV